MYVLSEHSSWQSIDKHIPIVKKLLKEVNRNLAKFEVVSWIGIPGVIQFITLILGNITASIYMSAAGTSVNTANQTNDIPQCQCDNTFIMTY